MSTDYLLGRTDDKDTFHQRFVSSNIMLLKGNLSFKELAEDITKKLSRIKIESTFAAGYL